MFDYYSSVGRKFRVFCSDGITRTARATAEPDTYFSIPASVQVRGKRVSGFVSSCDVFCEYAHENHFTAYTYGKNANMLPSK